jgi:microcompartment protein CcmK/EutM
MNMSREKEFEIEMKLGTVIGRVTLSKSVDLLKGGRYLIVSPFSREQYAKGLKAGAGMGKGFSPVVYDNLGGGVGEVIGYEEGREAAQPFEVYPPIDAINVALVDEMFYSPWKG